MKYTLGSSELRVQMMFIHVNPRDITPLSVEGLLSNAFVIADPQIKEGHLTEYVAYPESSSTGFKDVSHPIPGYVEPRTVEFVHRKLKTKLKHADDAYRNPGHVSTHPTKFLTKTTLIIVIGSRQFLMDTVDLTLEREGVLREKTFELVKIVANLKLYTARDKSNDNFLHLFIADERWYTGNIESLGSRAAKNVFSDEDMASRFSGA